MRGHEDRVLGVGFSEDGKRAVTASWDHTAKLWDCDTGCVLVTFAGHSRTPRRADFLRSCRRAGLDVVAVGNAKS